jgi:hypothetical protein
MSHIRNQESAFMFDDDKIKGLLIGGSILILKYRSKFQARLGF